MNRINQIAKVEVDLPREVDDEVAGDIEKESVFVSPHLERIEVAEDGAHAILHLREPEMAEEVVGKATRFLEAMCKRLTGFETNVIGATVRRDNGAYLPDAHAELVKQGWVFDYGDGYSAYRGPVLNFVRLLNAKVEALYRECFGFEDAHFPAFIDHETLHRAGYIESHPTAISMVANVIEDFDALESYRVANSCADAHSPPPKEHLHHGGVCLNPAACLPAYPTLADQTIGPEGRTISWLGRVFRYESRNVSGLDRLYEFNVREVVFVGGEDFVAERRKRAIPLILALAEWADLDMAMESATDPFFPTVAAAKKFFQQANDVKSEILLSTLGPDGKDKKLAGGSINVHGRFFGERFNIRTDDGEAAHTGCIGLGVERWAIAAFTQHGLDPDRWPEELRTEVFK